MHNKDVAARLFLMADLLELSGDTGFTVVAYRKAGRAIETLPEDIAAIAAAGRILEVPGIGKGIARKVLQILEDGTFPELEQLRSTVPPGLLDWIRVPGLGPRTAAMIHRELGIATLAELEQAAAAGRLRGLPGFGPKKEENILNGLRTLQERGGRALLAEVWPLAEEIRAALAACPAVHNVEVAGSVRRRQATIGDLDFVAASTDPQAVMDAFVSLPIVERVLQHGEKKSAVVLAGGRQADLRVVAPEQFGAALHLFTGSKEHNVAMRVRAKERGLKLNEYGVWPADGGPSLACADEADVFRALGLPWIAPELREDEGELAAAAAGKLPVLITPADVRGDLHTHSRWSDGRQSIKEMALAAKALGYEYIGIADHSQSLVIAGGLTPERLRDQWREIEEVNRTVEGITVLRCIEVDILRDGSLDLPDDVLAELDFVTASIHSAFQLDRAAQTARLEAAIRHPYVDNIGHATGRLLTRRAGYDADWPYLFKLAAAHGTAFEINASPERLDIGADLIRQALAAGVTLTINSDAHSAAGLETILFGVMEARRGWVEAGHVLNTLPLAELRRRRQRRRGR